MPTTSSRERPNPRSEDRRPYTTRVKITGPADFTLNSVGIKTEETESNGRRTVVWESDHPVSFFNVVAGRWNVKRGEGTAVYYDPRHPYNVDEILGCLDSARKYYSEWFFPYPWKELKLSEFPDLATYAQGFPTNISFSEGVGFLTSNSPTIHFAFEVTAHEAAPPVVGQHPDSGERPGREYPRGRDGPLLHHAACSSRSRARVRASTSPGGWRRTTRRTGIPTPSVPWSRSTAAAAVTRP